MYGRLCVVVHVFAKFTECCTFYYLQALKIQSQFQIDPGGGWAPLLTLAPSSGSTIYRAISKPYQPNASLCLVTPRPYLKVSRYSWMFFFKWKFKNFKVFFWPFFYFFNTLVFQTQIFWNLSFFNKNFLHFGYKHKFFNTYHYPFL